MTPVYINSKGESVVIAEMELSHLLYALVKNAKTLGKGGLNEIVVSQKTNEIKYMREDVLRRFADLSANSEI